jgi:hypothetical protein
MTIRHRGRGVQRVHPVAPETAHKQSTVHLSEPFVSRSMYDAGRRDVSLDTTVRVNVLPVRTPVNFAGGAGSMLIGPASIRYVPSAVNVPPGRTAGLENWPWPQPTTRSHPRSVTEMQAPSPLHRPVGSSVSPGPAGVRVHAQTTRQTSQLTRIADNPTGGSRGGSTGWPPEISCATSVFDAGPRPGCRDERSCHVARHRVQCLAGC